jgi:dCTP diphosphatase
MINERLDELLKRIDKFNKDRDWDQFHSPANLAKSISIEAGELLECFQWDEAKFDEMGAKEELADVLNYCLQMCLVLGYDPIGIVNDKMDKSEKKYPVGKAKGVATKYDKLK